MTGSSRSSEGLDPRRRRLLFRCWHRGTKEMDLLLGSFADACLDALSDDQLDDLEHLMGAADTDLFTWLSGGSCIRTGTGYLDCWSCK